MIWTVLGIFAVALVPFAFVLRWALIRSGRKLVAEMHPGELPPVDDRRR